MLLDVSLLETFDPNGRFELSFSVTIIKCRSNISVSIVPVSADQLTKLLVTVLFRIKDDLTNDQVTHLLRSIEGLQSSITGTKKFGHTD